MIGSRREEAKTEKKPFIEFDEDEQRKITLADKEAMAKFCLAESIDELDAVTAHLSRTHTYQEMQYFLCHSPQNILHYGLSPGLNYGFSEEFKRLHGKYLFATHTTLATQALRKGQYAMATWFITRGGTFSTCDTFGYQLQDELDIFRENITNTKIAHSYLNLLKEQRAITDFSNDLKNSDSFVERVFQYSTYFETVTYNSRWHYLDGITWAVPLMKRKKNEIFKILFETYHALFSLEQFKQLLTVFNPRDIPLKEQHQYIDRFLELGLPEYAQLMMTHGFSITEEQNKERIKLFAALDLNFSEKARIVQEIKPGFINKHHANIYNSSDSPQDDRQKEFIRYHQRMVLFIIYFIKNKMNSAKDAERLLDIVATLRKKNAFDFNLTHKNEFGKKREEANTPSTEIKEGTSYGDFTPSKEIEIVIRGLGKHKFFGLAEQKPFVSTMIKRNEKLNRAWWIHCEPQKDSYSNLAYEFFKLCNLPFINKKETVKEMSFFHWLIANLMPWCRGSAECAKQLLGAVWVIKLNEVPELGNTADCEALSQPDVSIYMSQYPRFPSRVKCESKENIGTMMQREDTLKKLLSPYLCQSLFQTEISVPTEESVIIKLINDYDLNSAMDYRS